MSVSDELQSTALRCTEMERKLKALEDEADEHKQAQHRLKDALSDMQSVYESENQAHTRIRSHSHVQCSDALMLSCMHVLTCIHRRSCGWRQSCRLSG